MAKWKISNAIAKMSELREQWHLQGHQFCRFQAFQWASFVGDFDAKPSYKLSGSPEGLEISAEPGWTQQELTNPDYNGFEFDNDDAFWSADQRNRVLEMYKAAGTAGLLADGCVMTSADIVLLGPLKLDKI